MKLIKFLTRSFSLFRDYRIELWIIPSCFILGSNFFDLGHPKDTLGIIMMIRDDAG